MKMAIKILKYIVFAILGFLVLVILWFAFWYLYRTGENEIYRIPNNYSGGIIIMFNSQNGVQEKYSDNGERIYEIPKNGILKTQFKMQDKKWLHSKFYFKSGQKIRHLIPSDKVWEDTININSKYKDSIYTYNTTVGGGNLWFLVGKPKEIDKNYKILDEMSNKLPLNTK